jgi:1-deoxy-D-xylulose-5-phosphate synthase
MKNILDKINCPADVKKLSIPELEVLSCEIRDLIIDTVVNKTGGHLASNLGVVELTIALHYVFDFPTDTIAFDVSHQCYTHKILTGRKDRFHTIRTLGGLSGFTNKAESKYDTFTAGHAGTSISTAVGVAEGYKFANKNAKAIALVGDASIGAGMCFEALNHVGHIDTSNLIVILNDNQMSISKPVGGLSKYFDKIRYTSFYKEVKKDMKFIASKMPFVGDRVSKFFHQAKKTLRSFSPEAGIFEDLNISYHGPTYGHNLYELIQQLEELKKLDGPIIFHVLTEKGRGYEEAELDPASYHGINPKKKAKPEGFVQSPVQKQEKKAFTTHFGDAILKLAEKDKSIVAITAAMDRGTGLDRFKDKFPDRFFDVGICEQHAIGFASGLQATGITPVVALYSSFLQRGFDQVMHEVCLQEIPVIFAIDRGGIVGADGATHNGVFDIAFLRTLPNIALMSPKDGDELQKMLFLAARQKCATAIRFPRGESPAFDKKYESDVEFGKAQLMEEGDDCYILAYGEFCEEALNARNILQEKGISAGVVNMRFAKPVDADMLKKIASKKVSIFTYENHAKSGGFGSAVLEAAAENSISFPSVTLIGIPDMFIEHGTQKEVYKRLGIDAEGVAALIEKKLAR